MGHHTEYLPVLENDNQSNDSIVSVAADGEPRGFRHYALRGRYRPLVKGDRKALAGRAARLELRMTAPMPWGAAPVGLRGAGEFIEKPQPDENDNPYIPAGYTYLARFVAHDMVATRVPFWATTNLDLDTANDRVDRLRLDVLYGGGRTQMPLIEVPADPEQLITSVFARLHDIFIARQQQFDAQGLGYAAPGDSAMRFAKARDATTLVYRRIVRDDLLKRLLHPAVYLHYSTGSPPFLDMLAGAMRCGVPLEFSHGALRFGQAMVRAAGQMRSKTSEDGESQGEGFASVSDAPVEPLLSGWPNFFNVPGSDPADIALSHRIGPWLTAVDPAPNHGVFYRDLINAELANLWSVQDLLGAMHDHPSLGWIVENTTFLRRSNWEGKIAAWLSGGDFQPGTGPWDAVPEAVRQTDIAAIAANPPLPFFVLFEAAEDPESKGCRLGRFGSILVADTLFGELSNKLKPEWAYRSLADQLKALHPCFADDAFKGPVTMASVIGFIDRHAAVRTGR
jgi:hypothetical protein